MVSDSQADSLGEKLLRGPLLTEERGTFFKKWRVRYFMLYKDFLSCFKLTKQGTMGDYVYKVKFKLIKLK